MRRQTNTNSIQTSRSYHWYRVLLGQNHGHRAGPIGARQSGGLFRNTRGDLRDLFPVGDVDDQRIILRAALGGKNARDGLRIVRVGGETIYGFGGNTDDLTAAQKLCGL